MNNEYIPYGEEWVKEMKKLPKDFLIGMIKDLNIARKETPTEAKGFEQILEDDYHAVSSTMEFDGIKKIWNDVLGAGLECKTVLYWQSIPQPPKR